VTINTLPTTPHHPSHTSGADGEFDELVERLSASGPDSPEHLVGSLIGYWGRERLADTINKFQTLKGSPAKLKKNPDVITGLRFVGLEENQGKRGSSTRAVFTYPEQKVGKDMARVRGVMMVGGPDEHGLGSVADVNLEERQITMPWTAERIEAGFYPKSVVEDGWVNPAPKPGVLRALGEDLLDASDDVNPVTLELLSAAPPRFATSGGPRDGVFTDDLEDVLGWIGQLDHSYVAVQGPPGAGKTYLGARAIYALVKGGKRVGITAMSHSAAENLLEAVHALFDEEEEIFLLRAVKRSAKKVVHGGLEGVTYCQYNAGCARNDFNVVVGTTWLFSSSEMQASPVDYLFIDEAGQLSLADAVAASGAAHNLILLGDPQQLAQVAQATHPDHSGASVLEHVLAGSKIIGSDRGVFLSETRRMHPEITNFISERFYEGQLDAHSSCAVQSVDDVGTGLRYLAATHEGCTTESPEEAELVHATILDLLGRGWTNSLGVTNTLEAIDFMVVAPFNDQVDLLRLRMDADPLTEGVQVGTVDKFQGREAPVVFFTMTTSSRSEMVRGAEFLFSPNRMNVAISRARCVAYLVATEALLVSPKSGDDAAPLVENALALVAAAKPLTELPSSGSRRK
jgi:uncharacterized protein